MLSLKQGLSLVSTRATGGWSPSDESSLASWYKYDTGITLNGANVSQWSDSSTYGHDMVQATASEQPLYSSGAIVFDPANTENLQTTTQLSLTGEFTIGMKVHPSAFNNVILGDNTTSNEFFKFAANNKIVVKIDGTLVNLFLDSGTFGDDYLVLTRDSSNVIRLHQNGTIQASSPTLAGTSDIDAIGVRATDINAYNGNVSEIQIYNSTSSTLTANVNNRLSNL